MTAPAITPREPDELPKRRLLVVACVSLSIALAAVVTATLLAPAELRSGAGRVLAPQAPEHIGVPEQTLIDSTGRGLSLRAAQRSKLERYGWVDRDAGIARIPIERAIELSVQGGD